MGGIPWASGAHPDLCHPQMQQGVPEHEASLQHPALPPWHGPGQQCDTTCPLKLLSSPRCLQLFQRGRTDYTATTVPSPDPGAQGSPPSAMCSPLPGGWQLPTAVHPFHAQPVPRPSWGERPQLNRLGPGWDRAFKTDLAETHGASCHDETEAGEHSPRRALQGFLAFPGIAEHRGLGH